MKKFVFDGVVVESAEFSNFKGRACVIFKILAHDVQSASQEQEQERFNVVAFGSKNTLVNFIKFKKDCRFLFEGLVRRTRLTDSCMVLDSNKYIDLYDFEHLKPEQTYKWSEYGYIRGNSVNDW